MEAVKAGIASGWVAVNPGMKISCGRGKGVFMMLSRPVLPCQPENLKLDIPGDGGKKSPLNRLIKRTFQYTGFNAV